MSKPYTEAALSEIFDLDLIWRRKELSDIKAAIKAADAASKSALLRAVVAMAYAHWEGYVKTCASNYFEYLTLRKKSFADYERQIYVNTMLVRLDSLSQSRMGMTARCQLINDILDGTSKRFTYVHPGLIDTKANLNTDVIRDICLVCGVDSAHFESKRAFIDLILLRRRNAIAHGQQVFVYEDEIESLIADVLALMAFFRNLLENKVYLRAYVAIAGAAAAA